MTYFEIRSRLYLRFFRITFARLKKIRYYSNKNIPSVGANLLGFVLKLARHIFRWFVWFYLAMNPNTKRQFNTFIFFERPTRFLSSGYNVLTFPLRYRDPGLGFTIPRFGIVPNPSSS